MAAVIYYTTTEHFAHKVDILEQGNGKHKNLDESDNSPNVMAGRLGQRMSRIGRNSNY